MRKILRAIGKNTELECRGIQIQSKANMSKMTNINSWKEEVPRKIEWRGTVWNVKHE